MTIASIDKAAMKVVEDLCARLNERELYDAASFPSFGTNGLVSWIEVLNECVWNTEDENSPPEDDWDNYDTILKHVEKNIETLKNELGELLAPF